MHVFCRAQQVGRKVFEKDAVIEHEHVWEFQYPFTKKVWFKRTGIERKQGVPSDGKQNKTHPQKKQTNPYRPNKQTKSSYCIALMIQLHNQYIFKITQL